MKLDRTKSVRDSAFWGRLEQIRYSIGSIFFFQAEDGIRDVERSRGLGDVYKRQVDYWGICRP